MKIFTKYLTVATGGVLLVSTVLPAPAVARPAVPATVTAAPARTAGLTGSADVVARHRAPRVTPHPAPPATSTSAGPATVTLLTGDRITLTAGGRGAAISRGPGRERIRFLTQREGGDLYVVPLDAQPLVAAGRLDRRLFNVSALVRHGYHDARRQNLPLIVVTRRSDPGGQVADLLTRPGLHRVRDLPAVDGTAATVAKTAATTVWAGLRTELTAATRAASGDPATRGGPTADSGPTTGAEPATRGGPVFAGTIERIWLDGQRQLSLDHSAAQIGAPAAHRAGYTGRGVRVAVLDTGIDNTHPDLAGRIAASANFTSSADTGDEVGHGTHVAGIIAGSGAASGGRYRGVAPDATLLNGKVCEAQGCTESDILAGMRWAAVEQRATVVNLSLGGPDGPELDPLEQAVNRLTEQTGALFVIAAGNDGPDGAVGSPGSADAALTVGAVDRDGELAYFSSQGPRTGDEAVKPDITAPGVGVVAARARGSVLGEPVNDRYTAMSGTSMATPHVAATAALLAQARPAWRAAALKAALIGSARPHPELTGYQQGGGRVDAGRAVGQVVTADPPALSYGRTLWPHRDDQPIVRTVSYWNDGAAPVTLDLALRVTGPQGRTPPRGMFTLSAPRVTVPAGGRAGVTVTVDTSRPTSDGYWSGNLLATGAVTAPVDGAADRAEGAATAPADGVADRAGGAAADPADGPVTVSTALGVHREVESYQLTVRHHDRAGRPATDHLSLLLGLDRLYFTQLQSGPQGTTSVRLPRGRYAVSSFIRTDRGGSDGEFTVLTRPELSLTRDTVLALDARRGKPVDVTVPNRSARPALVDISSIHFTAMGAFGVGLLADSFDNLFSAHSGPTVPGDRYVSLIASQWARPGPDGRLGSSPFLYALSEVFPGRLPTGLVRHHRAEDLATVRHNFGSGSPGQVAERVVMPYHAGNIGGWAVVLPAPVPGTRTEHLGTGDVRWLSELGYGVPDPDGWLQVQRVLQTGPVSYLPGQRLRERWNAAPYGPTLPAPRFSGEGVTRTGDLIRVMVPLHGDAAGHAGGSVIDTARTALFRDGRLIGETTDAGWGEFPVPGSAGDYRLLVGATRSVSELSTQVEIEWTFRSRRVGGDRPLRLPVLTVGYTPRLGPDNDAPAGTDLRIPFTVWRQDDGAPVALTAAEVSALTVDVSYDDGATWQPATVRTTTGGWAASVRHPAAGARYVSLRAAATDTTGGTVTQRIIRAYRLTG